MYKAYASYCISHLLAHMPDETNIERIILFGSAAKNEATKESDIDLFIEVNKKNKMFEKRIEKIISEFYKSREALLFRTKGISNKINVIMGRLEEWRDLRTSIESTGIVLYGRYTPQKSSGKKWAIIFWDAIEKNRGAFLNKIYGVSINKKRYAGVLEKRQGKRIGKSCIMIPMEYRNEFLTITKKYKVNAKIIEAYA